MNQQEYALTQLSEEAGELIQAASKTNRFGIDDVYDHLTNRAKLIEEMHDVRTAIDVVLERIGEKERFDKEHPAKDIHKRLKMSKWFEFAKKKGTVQ